MKTRRTLKQLYLCFLDAVINDPCPTKYEIKTSGLTKIQLFCKISYDKAIQRRDELIKLGLITDLPLKATAKGFEFYKIMTVIDYNRNLIAKSYLTESKEIPKIELLTMPLTKSKTVEEDAEVFRRQMIDFQQIKNANAAIIEELEKKKK